MERIEKLRLYKTAWSPVFSCYVGIVRVYLDENGADILLCKLAYTDQLHVFRANELTSYVL